VLTATRSGAFAGALRFASWLTAYESASLARTQAIGNGERELFEFGGQVDADDSDALWE